MQEEGIGGLKTRGVRGLRAVTHSLCSRRIGCVGNGGGGRAPSALLRLQPGDDAAKMKCSRCSPRIITNRMRRCWPVAARRWMTRWISRKSVAGCGAPSAHCCLRVGFPRGRPGARRFCWRLVFPWEFWDLGCCGVRLRRAARIRWPRPIFRHHCQSRQLLTLLLPLPSVPSISTPLMSPESTCSRHLTTNLRACNCR